MALYEFEYEVTAPGRIQRLSARFPETVWEVRPLGAHWLVRCTGPIDEPRTLPKYLDPGASAPGGAEPVATYLYPPSRADHRILADASRWGATPLPPLRWKAGRLTLRLAAHHEAPPPWWTARQGDARLLRKRRTTPRELLEQIDPPAGEVAPLSLRQSQVLLSAVRLGYYEVPRRSTVRDVARDLRIARSTAEEHLRAAESAMIRSIAPLVAARHAASTDAAGLDARSYEMFARFSTELQLFVQMAIRDERITQISFHRRRPYGTRTADHPYLRRVLAHVASGTDRLDDLPVELDVGPFARRVLEEVRRIPPGETRTYGEVARQLGEPRAARAVGNALAENPIPIVVPCHRVVPARGGIGAYSGEGGPVTKERLLRTEGGLEGVAPRRRRDPAAADTPRVKREGPPGRRSRRERSDVAIGSLVHKMTK